MLFPYMEQHNVAAQCSLYFNCWYLPYTHTKTYCNFLKTVDYFDTTRVIKRKTEFYTFSSLKRIVLQVRYFLYLTIIAVRIFFLGDYITKITFLACGT